MRKLTLIIACSSLLIVSNGLYSQDDVFEGKEISFTSSDGLEITADL